MRSGRVVFVIIVLLFGYYAYLILQPLDFHLSWATAVDDTFYYLGWARNVALGNGPTFDGVVFTNGVQPLWAAIITVLARVSTGSLNLLRLALAAAALFNLASLFLTWHILRRHVSHQAALAGALLFASMLTVSNVFLSGMEISVGLFGSTIVTGAYLTAFTSQGPSRRMLLAIGVALALAFLSRVDNLILAVFVILSLLARFRSSSSWRSVVLFAVLPVCLVAGIYFLLNYASSGLFLPISGEVKAAYRAREIASAYGGRFEPSYILAMLQHIPALLGMVIVWILRPFLTITPVAQYLLIAGVVAFAVVLIQHLLHHRTRPAFWFWGLLILTLAGIVHIYAFIWQLGPVAASNPWYYSLEYLLAIIWAAAAFDFLFRKYRGVGLRIIINGSIFAALVSTIITLPRAFYGLLDTQPSLYAFRVAAASIDAQVPDGARVGSFNAGVVGYFTQSTVINLDGLMNDEERLGAIRDNRPLREYLTKYRINYVADYSRAQAGEPLWGLEPEEYTVMFQQPFRDEVNDVVNFYLIRVKP